MVMTSNDVEVFRQRRRLTSGFFTWVILAATACGGAQAPAVSARQPDTNTAMSADTATIVVPRTFVGHVFVERDVVVASRAAGVVDSLPANLGTSVRADETLALIDRRVQEIALARAQLELGRARSVLSRSRELGQVGGITPVDSEQFEVVLQHAQLALREAQQAVEFTRVSAPFAGVVTARYVRPRQLVAPGDSLFRVSATAPQLVRVRLSDAAARSVRIGDRAIVRGTSGDMRESARVVLASPSLDPGSGTREVILQLASSRFLPGEDVAVDIGGEKKSAIVAPRSAVAKDGYVVVLDGTRSTLRPVVVGAMVDGDRVEILSGLSAGERLAPPQR